MVRARARGGHAWRTPSLSQLGQPGLRGMSFAGGAVEAEAQALRYGSTHAGRASAIRERMWIVDVRADVRHASPCELVFFTWQRCRCTSRRLKPFRLSSAQPASLPPPVTRPSLPSTLLIAAAQQPVKERDPNSPPSLLHHFLRQHAPRIRRAERQSIAASLTAASRLATPARCAQHQSCL